MAELERFILRKNAVIKNKASFYRDKTFGYFVFFTVTLTEDIDEKMKKGDDIHVITGNMTIGKDFYRYYKKGDPVELVGSPSDDWSFFEAQHIILKNLEKTGWIREI